MEYLKKKLATNIPVVVMMKKRLPSKEELDFNTKQPTGAQEFPYCFVLNGEEVWHYAKEYEEQNLSLFSEGQLLQVVRQEKAGKNGKNYKLMIWTPPDGIEAETAANPQPQTNTALEKSKKTADEYRASEDAKWERINTSKIIFGYMNTEMSLGKSPKEAAQTAVEAYGYQEQVVDKILSAKHYTEQ